MSFLNILNGSQKMSLVILKKMSLMVLSVSNRHFFPQYLVRDDFQIVEFSAVIHRRSV